jgi:hypothetical protein
MEFFQTFDSAARLRAARPGQPAPWLWRGCFARRLLIVQFHAWKFASLPLRPVVLEQFSGSSTGPRLPDSRWTQFVSSEARLKPTLLSGAIGIAGEGTRRVDVLSCQLTSGNGVIALRGSRALTRELGAAAAAATWLLSSGNSKVGQKSL